MIGTPIAADSPATPAPTRMNLSGFNVLSLKLVGAWVPFMMYGPTENLALDVLQWVCFLRAPADGLQMRRD